MNPMRPINPNEPGLTAPARAAGARAGVEPVTEVGATAAVAESAVSIDISVTSRAIADARRLDLSRLEALKRAVADGSYQPDPARIAQAIVEDALGPEAPK